MNKQGDGINYFNHYFYQKVIYSERAVTRRIIVINNSLVGHSLGPFYRKSSSVIFKFRLFKVLPYIFQKLLNRTACIVS